MQDQKEENTVCRPNRKLWSGKIVSWCKPRLNLHERNAKLWRASEDETSIAPQRLDAEAPVTLTLQFNTSSCKATSCRQTMLWHSDTLTIQGTLVRQDLLQLLNRILVATKWNQVESSASSRSLFKFLEKPFSIPFSHCSSSLLRGPLCRFSLLFSLSPCYVSLGFVGFVPGSDLWSIGLDANVWARR